jgi:hypothetical protein
MPVAGTYLVTHPLGQYIYDVTIAGNGVRGINQTQDIGDFIAPVDFTEALADGRFPRPSPAFDPAINEGIVNFFGRSVSTFFGVAGAQPLVDTRGNRYLAEAGLDITPVLNPIQRGINNVDFFSIELLNLANGATPGPGGDINGYFLNGANNSQTLTVSNFQISGKLFNDGNNIPPVALQDSAATGLDASIFIDVQTNDSDVSDLDPTNPTRGGALNVHGLNPQAIGLVDGTEILIAGTLTTANGASVRRIIDLPTGKARFFYAPPFGFSGEDSFEYVIQDTGGLLSDPTSVSITIEDLEVTRAEFRPKTGKWRIEGFSSDTTDNSMTATSAPSGYLTGSGVVPGPVETQAKGLTLLRISNDSIDYQTEILTDPLSVITEINIHFGDPLSNGPILFSLFDRQFDPPFDRSLMGTLTSANLMVKPEVGISSFSDAVQAVLDGRCYISILTVDNPAGELRAQLTTTPLGRASVQADGHWTINGRSKALPDNGLPNINVRSANGILSPGIPLQLR